MTQTNETPDEHSDVVGGSTAARRIGCPRSYALEKLVPPDSGNAYAREGTALHELIARIIDQDLSAGEIDALLPFTFAREAKGEDDPEGSWKYTITRDIWQDLGEPALAAFDSFIDEIEKETGGTFDFVVETRCAMPGIDGAFGTSDVIWSCGKMSGVWDWKFGRTPVSAEENMQLKFYGRAAASTMPHLFGPVGGVEGNDNAGSFGEIDPDREVILSIMQPQVSDEPDEYIVTVGELEEYRKTLVEAVDTAVRLGDKAPVQKGSWCNFATCKAICPLWAGRSADFGEKMARLQELQSEQKVEDLREVTVEVDGIELAFADMLPDLLDLAETAEVWARQVFALAHQTLLDGAPVEGWKLKAKRSPGREYAVEEDEVFAFMKNRRYKLDEYAPRKLLTVAQLEKLLKRDGKELPEELAVARPSSGTSLVREDNPAPEVKMSAQRARDLGDKLAGLAGKQEA